jgi:hypothetical protein
MALGPLFSASPGGFSALWCTPGVFLEKARRVVIAATGFSGFTLGDRDHGCRANLSQNHGAEYSVEVMVCERRASFDQEIK